MEQLAACCQTTHGIHPQNLRQSCRLGLSTSRHEQSSRALSRSCFRGYPELGMKNASVTACLVALNHVPLGQSFDNMGINTAYRKKTSDCEIPPATCEVCWSQSQSITWPAFALISLSPKRLGKHNPGIYSFNAMASYHAQSVPVWVCNSFYIRKHCFILCFLGTGTNRS